MKVYFDTSAVVPLLLNEAQTPTAVAIWRECAQVWAWDWMRVEAEAALSRRKADSTAWRTWRGLASEFHLAELAPIQLDALCAFNRALSLRATSAGHLFLYDRLLGAIPDLALLTFDNEMASAARRIGLQLHPACPG